MFWSSGGRFGNAHNVLEGLALGSFRFVGILPLSRLLYRVAVSGWDFDDVMGALSPLYELLIDSRENFSFRIMEDEYKERIDQAL